MVNDCRFISNKVDALKYLSNKKYNPKSVPKTLQAITNDPSFIRDYQYLVENFETILSKLKVDLTGTRLELFEVIEQIVRENKDSIWSDRIPILNKNLFVVEKTSIATYADMSISTSIKMATTLMKSYLDMGLNERMMVISETISNLSFAVKEFYRNSLAGKTGGSRDKIHLTAIPFSGRTVGTSITYAHKIDQFELPWKVAIILFRPQVINILVQDYGYSLKYARRLLIDSYFTYNKTVGEIFKRLIKESHDKDGIPFLVQRNPTLEQSSLMLLKCVKIKTDPYDTTISLSVLLMTFLSGDFDGDEYNFAQLINKSSVDGFKHLSPATSVMSYNEMGSLAGKVTITKATATIINRRINREIAESRDTGVILNEVF